MVRALTYAVIALTGVVSLVARPYVPAVMATHWNAAGVADGFGPRGVALLIMPGVMLLLLALFAAVPKLSPRGYQIEQMRGVYDGLVLATMIFMLAIHGLMISVALGHAVPMERVVPFAICLLFIVLGGFMARVTPNFFVGVRTPWTLTSPENWKATHRFTSRLFVGGGIGLALACIAGTGFWVVFAGFAAMGLLPLAYSLAEHLRSPS